MKHGRQRATHPTDTQGPWVGGRGGAGSWGKGRQGVRVFDLEPRKLWMEVQHRIVVPEPLGRLLDAGNTVGMEQTPKASLQSSGGHQGGPPRRGWTL